MYKTRPFLTFKNIYQFSNKVNYFNLFNLPRNFTQQQLKSSYLELVKKYHPDLSNQPNAAQFFRHIQEGYQVLSDNKKRQEHQQVHSTINLEPQNKDVYDQMVDKYYKTYQRKDLVNDEFNFSYNLFKKHYEKVEEPKANYQKYEGLGYDSYYAKKDEKPQSMKKHLTAGGSILAVLGLCYLYINM